MRLTFQFNYWLERRTPSNPFHQIRRPHPGIMIHDAQPAHGGRTMKPPPGSRTRLLGPPMVFNNYMGFPIR